MRTRTKQKPSYNLHGAIAYGATRAEAKAASIKRIENTFANACGVTVIRWRGVTGILSSYLDQCEYVLLHPESDSDQTGYMRHGSCMTSRDRTESLHDMRAHIASITWHCEDGITLPFVLARCPEHVHKQHLYMARWQLAFSYARDVLGMSDHNDCHRWACDHASQIDYSAQDGIVYLAESEPCQSS